MENAMKTKFLSSLEKCFPDEVLETKEEKSSFIMFHNEKLSFQLAYYWEGIRHREPVKVEVSGELAGHIRVRRVASVPSVYPVVPSACAGEYLRKEPGLYPELLLPLSYRGCVMLPERQLHTLWLDITLPDDFPAGQYSVSVSLCDGDVCLSTQSATVTVLSVCLPKQKLIHTEWFYADCLAEYYHTRVFSEKHWSIMENFIATAVRNGINMILTPVFTPELDTYIGGERMITQLVDITVTGKREYQFGFEKLERWIDMCRRLGVEYYEIPHFFTQWGAKAAPKFVAKVGGKQKKIFGWETDSMSEPYRHFLSCLIPALLDCLKKKGVDKKCYFHISDEPDRNTLEQYRKCKDILSPLLEGYAVIDALSDYEFYSSGVLAKPVPAIKRIKPFLENQVDGLWAYYCGAGGTGDPTTNRFLSMPLSRIRVLGVQLYKYNIEGFLHWGYNFYHNQRSYDFVNPYLDTTGEYFAPSGDAFLVYPGDNGGALETLRLNAMREAMDDIRALIWCESLYGREFAENLIDRAAGRNLTFEDYPEGGAWLIGLRETICRYAALSAEKEEKEKR